MGKRKSSHIIITLQERHVNWMITCLDPTPLAFFQYIFPTHRVRATEKYQKTLDLALNETDDQEVLNKLRRMKRAVDEARILFDWEAWMQQKTAILVRRSVRNTNLNIHEEINTFAQNKEPSAKRARIDKDQEAENSSDNETEDDDYQSDNDHQDDDGVEKRMVSEDDELEVYAKETIRDDGTKWIVCGTDVRDALTKWKQEKARPRTDLAFYDIIDMTPGSNSDFARLLPNDAVREIRKSKLLPTPVMDNEKGEQCAKGEKEEPDEQRFPGLEGDKVDGAKDYIINFIKERKFREYVDKSYMKTRTENTTKFIWDYMNLLVESFERDNDLADYNLSELGYREIFLTPLIRSLFRGMHREMNIFFGEKCLFASSEDRNLEKNDEENRSSGRKIDIIWSMKPTDLEFSISEVSGPPNQHNHTHFFNDKLKIAKMLKVIFNRIVRKYGGVMK